MRSAGKMECKKLPICFCQILTSPSLAVRYTRVKLPVKVLSEILASIVKARKIDGPEEDEVCGKISPLLRVCSFRIQDSEDFLFETDDDEDSQDGGSSKFTRLETSLKTISR